MSAGPMRACVQIASLSPLLKPTKKANNTILDPVCLFGVMCPLAEDASHLRMRCVAKLCVQHQTVKTDRAFINGASKFPWVNLGGR